MLQLQRKPMQHPKQHFQLNFKEEHLLKKMPKRKKPSQLLMKRKPSPLVYHQSFKILLQRTPKKKIPKQRKRRKLLSKTPKKLPRKKMPKLKIKMMRAKKTQRKRRTKKRM